MVHIGKELVFDDLRGELHPDSLPPRCLIDRLAERFHQFGVVPCPQVVDTLGAGDSYIAGFLTGLWEGRTIEGAMERGAACATETLGYFGAW